MEITIQRLGHRQDRDKRITPHGELVRRALGAKGMLLASGDKGIGSNLTLYGENILSFAGLLSRANLYAQKPLMNVSKCLLATYLML